MSRAVKWLNSKFTKLNKLNPVEMAGNIAGKITEQTINKDKSDVLSETGSEIFDESALNRMETVVEKEKSKKRKNIGVTKFIKSVVKGVKDEFKQVADGFDEAIGDGVKVDKDIFNNIKKVGCLFGDSDDEETLLEKNIIKEEREEWLREHQQKVLLIDGWKINEKRMNLDLPTTDAQEKIKRVFDRVTLHRNHQFIKEEFGLPQELDIEEIERFRLPKEQLKCCEICEVEWENSKNSQSFHRFNCKRCGRYVCKNCSSTKRKLFIGMQDQERICDLCDLVMENNEMLSDLSLRKDLNQDCVEIKEWENMTLGQVKHEIKQNIKRSKQSVRKCDMRLFKTQTQNLYFADKAEILRDENNMLRIQKAALETEFLNLKENNEEYRESIPDIKLKRLTVTMRKSTKMSRDQLNNLNQTQTPTSVFNSTKNQNKDLEFGKKKKKRGSSQKESRQKKSLQKALRQQLKQDQEELLKLSRQDTGGSRSSQEPSTMILRPSIAVQMDQHEQKLKEESDKRKSVFQGIYSQEKIETSQRSATSSNSSVVSSDSETSQDRKLIIDERKKKLHRTHLHRIKTREIEDMEFDK